MSEDKTYLVIDSLRRKSDNRYTVNTEWDVRIFYDDNALQNYTMSPPTDTSGIGIFPLFRTHADQNKFAYAVELPKSVKTNTGELLYLHINPWNGISSLGYDTMTAVQIDTIKHLQSGITYTNETNAKIVAVTNHSAIVGLPVPSKNVSQQVISSLI